MNPEIYNVIADTDTFRDIPRLKYFEDNCLDVDFSVLKSRCLQTMLYSN